MIVALLFLCGLVGYEVGLNENDIYVDQIARSCNARVQQAQVECTNNMNDLLIKCLDDQLESCPE